MKIEISKRCPFLFGIMFVLLAALRAASGSWYLAGLNAVLAVLSFCRYFAPPNEDPEE
jgi:hypothetical protein